MYTEFLLFILRRVSSIPNKKLSLVFVLVKLYYQNIKVMRNGEHDETYRKIWFASGRSSC